MNPSVTAAHFAPPAPASLAMGVIGNCAFSALIDLHGRLVWCCLPRFDGDPVFHALLDAGKTPADQLDAGHNAFAI